MARHLQGEKARGGGGSDELANKEGRGGFSSPLVKVAIWSIALGVAVMVVSVCVLRGFQGEIRRKAVGFGSHIVVKSYNMGKTYDETPVDMRRQEVKRIASTPGVKNVGFFAVKGGMVKTDDQIEGIVLKGVGEGFDTTFFGECLQEGRLFEQSNNNTTSNIEGTSNTPEAIVSRLLADRLEIGVGDKLRVYFWQGESYRARVLQVSGIYSTDLSDFDKHVVVCDLGVVQRLNNWEDFQAGGYEITVEDFNHLDEVVAALIGQLGYDLTLTTIVDEYPALFAWLDLLDSNVVLIIAIMLLVCAVSVVSALLIFIFEKGSTIGVLKALGTDNGSIRRMFVLKGGIISLKGVLAGVAVSVALCGAQKWQGLVKLDPAYYAMSTVPVELNGWTVVAVALGTMAVCIIAMLLPAAYVARIEPARSIRFE